MVVRDRHHHYHLAAEVEVEGQPRRSYPGEAEAEEARQLNLVEVEGLNYPSLPRLHLTDLPQSSYHLQDQEEGEGVRLHRGLTNNSTSDNNLYGKNHNGVTVNKARSFLLC